MTRILTAILSAIIFCSCQSISGSGNIITQNRNVSQFDGVRASGSIDIEVVNDQTHSIRVEADDNIMPYIITKVEDGILDVHLKPNFMYHNINAKVYVTAPSLTKLTVSGSGSITAKDTLANAAQIDFKVSGSGDVTAIVDAPSINAEIGGSGTITLSGKTKDFIKCKNLLSENTTAGITGSGTAHVFASVHLLAKVTGSGDIYYSGQPSVEIHKTGSGTIEAEK
jgi:hypothetical protein